MRAVEQQVRPGGAWRIGMSAVSSDEKAARRRASMAARASSSGNCGPVTAASAAILRDGGGADGERLFQLHHGRHDRLRPGEVADAPAGERIGEGEAADGQRPFRHAGQGADAAMAASRRRRTGRRSRHRSPPRLCSTASAASACSTHSPCTTPAGTSGEPSTSTRVSGVMARATRSGSTANPRRGAAADAGDTGLRVPRDVA